MNDSPIVSLYSRPPHYCVGWKDGEGVGLKVGLVVGELLGVFVGLKEGVGISSQHISAISSSRYPLA